MAGFNYIGNPDFRGWLAYQNDRALNYVGNDGGVNRNELNEYNQAAPGANVTDQSLQDTEAARVAGLWDQFQRLGGAQTLGASTYGSSGSSSSYNPQDLQMLDQQKTLYERLLQSIDAAERSGMEDLQTSETQSRNKANQQRSRQLEDFGVKREDFTRGQTQALNQVGDNSRTLRGSLMRRLGLASGGGSAFDVADNAVARDASKNRAGVQETYGQNFRNLALSEKRGLEDFTSLLDEIAAERRTGEERFKAGILGQRQGIQQSLAQIMADRAGLLGGNQLAASQPYVNNYLSYQDQIDRLPSQYDTNVTARDLNVQTPTLKDYVVNRANIGGGQTQQQYSPYSNFLRQRSDEEEQQVA